MVKYISTTATKTVFTTTEDGTVDRLRNPTPVHDDVIDVHKSWNHSLEVDPRKL